MNLTKTAIIQQLQLVEHMEGGYFVESYRSPESLSTQRSGNLRNLCTSIYYLLTDDRPIDYLHKNQSDIIHYFHGGSPITYLIIHPEGRLETAKLGFNLSAGEQPQLLVSGNCWKAAFLPSGEYGLLGEAVAPGFDYRDLEIASPSILTQFPHLAAQIEPYLGPC